MQAVIHVGEESEPYVKLLVQKRVDLAIKIVETWQTEQLKPYFISPIVNMEKLITDMMQWANVPEAELKTKGVIHSAFGEDLSWQYLCYVREHPIDWKVTTSILYGSHDNLTSFETVSDFAKTHRATLTVMESGAHWFHTEAQMRFLDDWIRSCEGGDLCSH